MPNQFDLITKYSANVLDEIFKKASVTAILEGNSNLYNFVNAKTVMIPDVVLSQLGAYDRENGYSKGNIQVNYTPYTLTQDRGTAFEWDEMDAEETVVAQYPVIQRLFVEEQSTPQVDAYRLSKLRASADPVGIVTETVAANKIITRFNDAIKYFEDNEVGLNGAFFISTEINKQLKETTELARKITQMDFKNASGITFTVPAYENIPIIVVPPKRFKTEYDFTATGYNEKVGATDINFMLVNFMSALPIAKHRKVRYFNPTENQGKNAHKFDYRLYHDIIVPANKQKGIYVSEKAGA